MIFFIVLFIGHILLVFPKMIQTKQWKDMIVIGLISLFGVTIAGLFIFQVELPQISTEIGLLFKKIYKIVGFNPPK